MSPMGHTSSVSLTGGERARKLANRRETLSQQFSVVLHSFAASDSVRLLWCLLAALSCIRVLCTLLAVSRPLPHTLATAALEWLLSQWRLAMPSASRKEQQQLQQPAPAHRRPMQRLWQSKCALSCLCLLQWNESRQWQTLQSLSMQRQPFPMTAITLHAIAYVYVYVCRPATLPGKSKRRQ